MDIEIIPWEKNPLSPLPKELQHSSDLHFSLIKEKHIESVASSKVKCLFVVRGLDAIPDSLSHRTVECNCWKERGCFLGTEIHRLVQPLFYCSRKGGPSNS